ncbi:MAG: hypothetical protein ACLFRK_00820 [Candidatus Nanohaloarchaea archaeon]
MDILGKKGEEASKNLRDVADAVEGLDSHLNALDNAVQHHDQQLDQIVENLRREEEFLEHIEHNRSRIGKLRKLFKRFASMQSNYFEKVDENSSKLEKLSRIDSRTSRMKQRQDELFEELEALTQKVNEIENEFILDENRQEWDINSKVGESEFKDHRKKMEQELSKLRTSINTLAEEIDEEEIEVEPI